ncbi:FecR domain-containing protein [Planctomycetota bacterium]
MMDPDLQFLLCAWLGSEGDYERVDQSQQDRILDRLRNDGVFRREFVDEILMLGNIKAIQSNEPRWLALEDEFKSIHGQANGSIESGSVPCECPPHSDDRLESVEEAVIDEVRHEVSIGLEPAPATAPIVDAEKLQAIEAQADRKLQSFLAEQERLRREQEQQATRRPARSFDVVEATQYLLRKIDNVLSLAAKITVFSAVGLALILLFVVGIQTYKKYRVVAVLGESVHAQWRQAPETPTLRAGTLFLEQGYAQLRFKKGADVIIQAPCQLHLNSPNMMTLESGTVSAKVPISAHGFTIGTPSAKVIDHGTAFGVLMDAANQAEIQVFEGEVDVRSTALTQRSATYRLERGENALANWTAGIQVGRAKYGEAHFVRQLPDPSGLGIPGKRIDLADIVGAGNGFGTGKAVEDRGHAVGTISPFNGKINDLTPPDKRESAGVLHSFMPVKELPFVDGIFIPDQSEGDCVVSSKGHIFSQCPDTDGNALMNIANGWNLQAKEKTPRAWAEAHGISIHANLGLTFDLQAIRDTMPGIEIVSFVAQAGIPYSSEPEVSDADIWILVDGHTRFSQKAVCPPQMVNIDIPLAMGARFLTLMVTDGLVARGGANKPSAWDWCFFTEPILELEASYDD